MILKLEDTLDKLANYTLCTIYYLFVLMILSNL